jgi:hypothetical protein
MYPYYDMSLSWISSIKPFGKILDIGAGFDLSRFIPANDVYTTPRFERNLKEISNIRYVTKTDTASGLTVTDSLGDSLFYTYKGTKLMGRLTFDFKGFFPDFGAGIFGENDGKLYSEVAVLGLENQGVEDPEHNLHAYYDKLWQRIPLMFGFNIPTFKFLDVLSLEAEYYRMPYPNDFGNQLRWSSPQQGCPIPNDGLGDYLRTITNIYDTDSWKWSVYARKIFNNHFALILQAARDHSRTRSTYSLYADGEECLVKNVQWYWALKAVSFF